MNEMRFGLGSCHAECGLLHRRVDVELVDGVGKQDAEEGAQAEERLGGEAEDLVHDLAADELRRRVEQDTDLHESEADEENQLAEHDGVHEPWDLPLGNCIGTVRISYMPAELNQHGRPDEKLRRPSEGVHYEPLP
eukprot:4052865-Pleurochrysis_carterae.AAC.2